MSIHPYFPSLRLEGKAALVTGGARGIGASIVRSLLHHGARVCVADILDDLGHSNNSSSTSYIHCDVALEEDVRGAVSHVVNRFGSLDIMVNNAGVLGPTLRDIREFGLPEFDRVLRVNARGTFLGMKHAARVMVPARAGSIVSVCSVSGCVGGIGDHAYTGSKHAVVGLTESVAREVGEHGVRVNCVSPYGIVTKLSVGVIAEGQRKGEADFARLRDVTRDSANLKGVELTADDVADAVVFLASDEARGLNGTNLMIDGGFTAVKHSFRAEKFN